jgi:hypothetical protein
MATALVFTVLSLSIRRYERPFDPEKVIRGFTAPPKDPEFLEDRVIDYSVATTRTSR